MADSLDTSLQLISGEYATAVFEAYWYDVTLLGLGIDDIDMFIRLFSDGYATPVFEALWNTAADGLGKDRLDINVILITDEGKPTAEFEALWEDLIT